MWDTLAHSFSAQQGDVAESFGLVVWVSVLIVDLDAPSPLPQVGCNVDHRALPLYTIKWTYNDNKIGQYVDVLCIRHQDHI